MKLTIKELEEIDLALSKGIEYSWVNNIKLAIQLLEKIRNEIKKNENERR